MTAKHLPNLISACRLAATPVLLYSALARHRELFTWLLVTCLLSDIADGLIARAWHLESKLGAFLDSTADFLVTVFAGVGMVTLQPAFVASHAAELVGLVVLYAGEVTVAFARYGRLSSFHTYASRIAAYAQGIFFAGLFVWGAPAWLYYAMLAIAYFAYLEEFVLLALLPEWVHDVRGVYWVLRQRRNAR